MFKNQPKGLIAAAFANMGERFGFYTMMAILVLFLQAKFGVSGKDAIFAREGFSQRYASGVNDKVWSAAQRLGYGKYFVNTEGGYITDDHVYVNRMGIPSIDIIQYDPNTETGFCKQWHTLDDTMDFIDKETLKAVGQTVLEIIYNE